MSHDRWPEREALSVPEELRVRDDPWDDEPPSPRRLGMKVVAVVVALAMILTMVGVLIFSGVFVWM